MAEGFLRVVAGARRGLNVPLPTDRPLVIGRKDGDPRFYSGSLMQVT